MKVKIGKYKDWFGPYQLAQKLMFWVPKEEDEYGFEHTAERVHKFGEWLAYGSIEPEKDIWRPHDRPQTLLYKFLTWIDSKKKRTVEVKIHDYDTWNMETTLGFIIRPMLRQFKEQNRGVPYVDPEDCPSVVDDEEKRWNWVLDEMIFAFETLPGGKYEDWPEKFCTGEHDIFFEKAGEGYEMKTGPNDTFEIDRESLEQYNKRISAGFLLFGKYYRDLWT